MSKRGIYAVAAFWIAVGVVIALSAWNLAFLRGAFIVVTLVLLSLFASWIIYLIFEDEGRI